MKGEIYLWDALFGNGDTAKEALKFLTDYQDYLQFQDMFGWLGNVIAWGYIKFVFIINSFLEGLLTRSFDVGGFLKSQGLSDLQTTFVVVLSGVLLAVAAAIAGIKMMINRKKAPELKDLLVNLFISVFLLVYGGTIINDLFDISKDTFTDLTQIESNPPSLQLIQDNTKDLTIVLKTGINNIKKEDKLNNITKDNFKDTNMTLAITPDDLGDIVKATGNEDAKYLEYEIDVDNKGKKTAVPYKDNFLSKNVAPSGYRRFASNRLVIAVGETSLIIGYVFIIFTIIMCIFELGYKKVYLAVVAATDIETGQRRNKALEGVVQSLLLIAFTGLELNIYMQIMQFLGENTLDPYIYVISMVVATFLLFKGSQTVSSLFGVDTSMKNGAGMLMGTIAAAGLLNRNKRNGQSGDGFIKRNLNKIRNRGNNEDTDDKDTEKDSSSDRNKPKPSLAERARNVSSKAGKAKGYVSERKLKGTIGDGLSVVGDTAKDVGNMAKDKVTKPIKDAKNIADNVKGGFNEGVTTGLVKGYEKKGNQQKNTSNEPQKPKAPIRNLSTDIPKENNANFTPESRSSSLSNLTDNRNDQVDNKVAKKVAVNTKAATDVTNKNTGSPTANTDKSSVGTIKTPNSNHSTSETVTSKQDVTHTVKNEKQVKVNTVTMNESGAKLQAEKNKLKNTLKGK